MRAPATPAARSRVRGGGADDVSAGSGGVRSRRVAEEGLHRARAHRHQRLRARRASAYPLAAYLFHAVKLGALRRSAGCSSAASRPGSARSRTSRSWIFEGIAFQKAFLWASLFEVMGFGCMSGPLGLQHLAAVHRVPALPAPGHDEAGAVPEPAALRRHDAHLARRRALRGAPAVAAARARAAGDRRRASRPDRRPAAALRARRQDDPPRRARRAPLRDDRLLPVRRELDRRLQVGAARDLVLGGRLEAHGRVRLRRADHDRQQSRC